MPNAKPIVTKCVRDQSPNLTAPDHFIGIKLEPFLDNRDRWHYTNISLHIKRLLKSRHGITIGIIKNFFIIELLVRLNLFDLRRKVRHRGRPCEENLSDEDSDGNDQYLLTHRRTSHEFAFATAGVGTIASVIAVFKSHLSQSKNNQRIRLTIGTYIGSKVKDFCLLSSPHFVLDSV